MTDTIVIKAPAGTKTRWVRQSQARGQKLSDWIVRRVDRPANQMATTPCPTCTSLVLVSDGEDAWHCAQCGAPR